MTIDPGLYSGRMKKRADGVPHSFICYVPSNDCMIEDISVYHVTPVDGSDTHAFVDSKGNRSALKVESGNYILKADKENLLKEIVFIPDQAGAIQRLNNILQSDNNFTSSEYCVFANNCEQFANYVATGEFRSQSWQTFRNVATSVVAGIVLLSGRRQQA